jgi:tetratricopeptide (TPR) repeat protein
MYPSASSSALEQYLKVQELEPDETTVVNMIGDIYLRLNQKGEALLYYQSWPSCLRWQDKPLQAAAAYKKGLQLIPDNPGIPVRLASFTNGQDISQCQAPIQDDCGNQLIASGRYDQAVETCQKICRLDPNS